MANNQRTMDVTDATFEQHVLKSNLPVLVDFWAVWCGPCRMLEPTIEAIAEEYAGKIVVARVNVDENPETAGRYGIKGIPTLILFKDGEQKDSRVGVRPKEDIADMINRHLD